MIAAVPRDQVGIDGSDLVDGERSAAYRLRRFLSVDGEESEVPPVGLGGVVLRLFSCELREGGTVAALGFLQDFCCFRAVLDEDVTSANLRGTVELGGVRVVGGLPLRR